MLVEINNLSYKDILFNISLEIDRGEVVLFEGDRSETLLRIISGEIKRGISGKAQTPSSSLLERECDSVMTGCSVLDEVTRVLREKKLSKVEKRDKAKKMLNSFAIRDELFYKSTLYLSQGEKKRVLLSSLFSLERDLYILLDPYIYLDTSGRNLLNSYIEKIIKDGKSVLITSTVDTPRTRTIKIENGKISLDNKEKVSFCFNDDDKIKNFLYNKNIIKDKDGSAEEDADALLSFLRSKND